MISNELITIFANQSIDRERLARTIGNGSLDYFKDIVREVVSVVNSYIDYNKLTKAQINQILKASDASVTKYLDDFIYWYTEQQEAIVIHELDYNHDAIEQVTVDTYEAQTSNYNAVYLKAIARPIKLSDTSATAYTSMLKNFKNGKREQVNSIINNSFLYGNSTEQTAQQITHDLKNWSAKSKSDATRIVRTGLNHFGNMTSLEIGEANQDIIIGYRSIAVVDNSTSQICRSLDNEVLKESDPRFKNFVCPRHPNCRSIIIPELNGKYIDESDDTKRPTNFRQDNELTPKVQSSNQTYYESLAKLKKADREAILGKTLSDAFTRLNNPSEFARYTRDDATLKPLTIEEITKRDNKLSRILNNDN